ncbi:MAG: phosphatidate cytidylyltransferase [Candidatus Korobacteraceae bacterium]
MKRVVTAIVLIPVVLLLALRSPVYVLAPFVGLAALLCIREFLELARHYGIEPSPLPVYGFTILLFLGLTLQPFVIAPFNIPLTLLSVPLTFGAIAIAAVLAPFVFLAIAMARSNLQSAFPAAASGMFAIAYIALPLALVVQLRLMWAGAFLILYLLLLVWTGDTAAYYAGRLLGRHKLAPRISPGKTWEGTAASFLASVAVGVWIFSNAPQISQTLWNVGLIERGQGYFALEGPSILSIAVLSGMVNIAAQLGDLVESLLKRGAGVKDSGSLLPGHGGMLDRLDALLFAAPILWYYAALQVIAQGHL